MLHRLTNTFYFYNLVVIHEWFFETTQRSIWKVFKYYQSICMNQGLTSTSFMVIYNIMVIWQLRQIKLVIETTRHVTENNNRKQ